MAVMVWKDCLFPRRFRYDIGAIGGIQGRPKGAPRAASTGVEGLVSAGLWGCVASASVGMASAIWDGMSKPTRYMTKRCPCGVITSTLATPAAMRAADMHLGFPSTNPAPARGQIRRARSGGWALLCRGCGAERRALPVAGKLSPAHVCNAKCIEGKGFTCECSCGGANHGAGHSSAAA